MTVPASRDWQARGTAWGVTVLYDELLTPTNDNDATSGRVGRRHRLGGVLNDFYHREVA